jgi:hypothetical protein
MDGSSIALQCADLRSRNSYVVDESAVQAHTVPVPPTPTHHMHPTTLQPHLILPHHTPKANKQYQHPAERTSFSFLSFSLSRLRCRRCRSSRVSSIF